MSQQQTADRNSKGRFQAGNQVCYQGWRALVDKRFGGDEAACKAWWGRMGAYYYDTVYRNIGLGAMKHPGTPEEFLQQRRKAAKAQSCKVAGCTPANRLCSFASSGPASTLHPCNPATLLNFTLEELPELPF